MPGRAGASQRRLATVFFTDMVGSTEIAARLGDRRWRQLLSVFHRIVRKSLRGAGGREVDSAGDGFFAVFEQPARAIACACAMTDDLHGVGIEVRTGIHMGEVETVGHKLGGIAVHIGARLNTQATPGQVVISSTVYDVVSGSDYELTDLGLHTLKGVPREWRLFGVSWPGARPLDTDAINAWAAGAVPGRRSALRRYAPAAVGVVVAAVLAGVAVAVLHARAPAPKVPGPNTAASIDAASVAFTADAPVGGHPTGVAIGGGAVWVISASDQTLTRIDIASGLVTRNESVGGTPTAIAFGADSVWVTAASSGAVFRFDATGQPGRRIQVKDGVAGAAYGANALWVANPLDDTVIRIDPVTNGVAEPIAVGHGPQAVAVSGNTVWVANTLDRTLTWIDAATNKPHGGIAVGPEPDALAADANGVWVASTAANKVIRFDASSRQLITTIAVGTGPVDLTVGGDGTVWVAESTAEKVERLDPQSNRVVASLTVHGHPEAIDSQNALLWVAVSAD